MIATHSRNWLCGPFQVRSHLCNSNDWRVSQNKWWHASPLNLAIKDRKSAQGFWVLVQVPPTLWNPRLSAPPQQCECSHCCSHPQPPGHKQHESGHSFTLLTIPGPVLLVTGICFKDTRIFIHQWHKNVHWNLSWWHFNHSKWTVHNGYQSNEK